MAQVKMLLNNNQIVYVGPIIEECFDLIKRYDDPSFDMDRHACGVLYSFDPSVPETDIEKRLLERLGDYEFSCFDTGVENEVMWTMK
jgi:hypothetical protein